MNTVRINTGRIIVTLLIMMCMIIVSDPVYAAADYPVSTGTSVSFTKGGYVLYGSDYTKSGTYKMTVKLPGESGSGNVYCIQPWLGNPGSGKRKIAEIYDASSSNRYAEAIRTMMYYSNNYPGSSWADSNWFINRTGSDYDMAWVSSGNEKTAVMHLAASMAYYEWKKSGSPLKSMPAYSGGTVKGNTYSKYWNAAYCIYQSALRTADGFSGSFELNNIEVFIPEKAPSDFAVGIVKVSGKQDLVLGINGIKMSGSLRIVKRSSNEAYTSGNAAYDFSGIEYKIYRNQNCTEEASENSLIPGGTAIDLDTGTYYIKEFQTNECYEKSDEVLQAVVSDNSVCTVEAYDELHTVTVSFRKTCLSSADEASDLSGFRFTLSGTWSTSAPCFEAVSNRMGIVKFKDIPMGKYILNEDPESVEIRNKDIASGYFEIGEGLVHRSVNVTENTDRLIPETDAANIFHSDSGITSDIVVNKIVEDGSGCELRSISAEGFQIELSGRETSSSKEIRKSAVTDDSGTVRFSDIPPGSYCVRELMTAEQERYYTCKESDGVMLETGGGVRYLTLHNTVQSSAVKVHKTADDGKITGVGFTLTGHDFLGNEISPMEGHTDANGMIDFGMFLPGDYVVEESDFDSSIYYTDDTYGPDGKPVRKIHIGENGGDTEVLFKNCSYKISLTKTEKTENGTVTDQPVEGAEYALFEVVLDEDEDGPTENEYRISEIQATDANGRLSFRVEKGRKYRVREITVPGGYINPENAVYEDITVSDRDNKVTADGLIHNQRECCSVSIHKYDGISNAPIPEAGFTLYSDKNCENAIDEFDLTDERGHTEISGLEWGTYYVKETRTPNGYVENSDVIEVRLGRWKNPSGGFSSCTEAELSLANEPVKGSVTLTKTDADTGKAICRSGAVFDLYSSDAELISEDLMTDDNGQLSVSDLEWGSYYFVEKQAPEGYSVDPDPIRFTVNSYSAKKDGSQEVLCPNEKLSNTVIVTKEIDAEDIWYEHGTPTFFFTLSGTDVNGKQHVYNRTVTFSEEYVKKHRNILDGTVSASATFSDITSGTYELGEAETDRYSLKKISNVSSNGTICDSKVCFEIYGNTALPTVSYATFYNEKTDWNDYSDQTTVTNSINKSRTFTALAADFFSDDREEMIENNLPITAEWKDSHLKVYAVYDDGTERQLDSSEYEITDEVGNIMINAPKTAGEYTAVVTHTEKGTVRNDTFMFRIDPPEKLHITFVTYGGSKPTGPSEIYKYDSLNDASKNPAAYITEKSGYWLGDPENEDVAEGWYLDSGYNSKMDFSAPITEDITLYAKWEKKDLGECSWEEIEDIANGNALDISGTDTVSAADFFDRDFNEVRRDLADDGLLTATTLKKYTAGFAIDGKQYHAMIAGFGHDKVSDGGAAGITFMSYESAGSYAMSSETVEGGWQGSDMRLKVLPTVRNKLSVPLKTSITEVMKKTADNNGSIVETADDLFVPSVEELYGVYAFDSYTYR